MLTFSDMLDEFSSTKLDDKATKAAAPISNATKPNTSGPGRPLPTVDNVEEPTEEEDAFAKQLQSGMADMLRELEQNPDMAKQFEEMMAQFGAPPFAPGQASATKAPSAGAATSKKEAKAASSTTTAAAPQADKDFQSTIRKTMDRMKASSDSASAANTDGNAMGDDMMATLLKEMQAANGGADGEGDESFSKMLLGMMEQLTNKEILYEPMKELDQKFPSWLEEHSGKLSTEDETRYRTQRDIVREIVARFERPGYSDGHSDDREFIVERMQKVSGPETH